MITTNPVFPTGKRRELELLLVDVFPHPYMLTVKNEDIEPHNVSVFNKEFNDPQISIVSNVPETSYSEMCLSFVNKKAIGLFLVKIISPTKEMLQYLRFQFKRKDGRGPVSVATIDLKNDYNDEETNIIFTSMDFEMDILTNINFVIPPHGEIELHIYEKREDVGAIV
jgi:hypothetical protein